MVPSGYVVIYVVHSYIYLQYFCEKKNHENY